jgi:hypothetical protein
MTPQDFKPKEDYQDMLVAHMVGFEKGKDAMEARFAKEAPDAHARWKAAQI